MRFAKLGRLYRGSKVAPVSHHLFSNTTTNSPNPYYYTPSGAVFPMISSGFTSPQPTGTLLNLLLRRIFQDAYFVPEQSLVTVRNSFFKIDLILKKVYNVLVAFCSIFHCVIVFTQCIFFTIGKSMENIVIVESKEVKTCFDCKSSHGRQKQYKTYDIV